MTTPPISEQSTTCERLPAGSMTAAPEASGRSATFSLPLAHVFGDPVVGAQFSDYAYVEAWLSVERALARAQSELGLIPKSAADAIIEHAVPSRIDIDLLRARTTTVGYPILPLLEQINASAPREVSDFIHWGATTQDIMDTGLVLQCRAALERIAELLDGVAQRMCELAAHHRTTLMVARTHAQPAVPTTFGSKLAVWLSEAARHRD